MKKNILGLVSLIVSSFLVSVPAFAHSVVTPNQVGIAATQLFTLSAPSEKDASTVVVKLMLPAGLNFVTPVVQGGWTATVKTGPIPSGMQAPVAADGDVADSIPTEIDWTGGTIPAEQKGLFQFTAQVPAQPTELDWKIEQSYSDGSTVSWNLGPNDSQPKDDKGNPDFDSAGPYSKTMVVNDLTSPVPVPARLESNQSSQVSLVFSLVAIALSAMALSLARGLKGKKN